MSPAEAALAQLTARVQRLEDEQAILRLLMTHPMAVDGGAGDWWMDHWTEGALVDRLPDPERHSGDYAGIYGQAPMRAEIRSPELEALRQSGFCHFATAPAVRIEGDIAHATNALQLLGVEGTGYRLRRVVLSRWELQRGDEGWRITRRTMRPLGHPEARALMLRSLPASAGPAEGASNNDERRPL